MGALTENRKRRLAVDLRLSSSAHPVFHLAAEPSPPSKKIKRLSPPVSLCAITPLTQVAQTPTPAARSFPPPAPLPRPVHGPQRILRAFGLGSANGSRLLPSPEGSKNTPPEGSKNTPPHHSTKFRWKDYCPMVLRHLRILFDVDPADYMLAVCGNDALSELSSPGKSGSVFHLTQDDRFMIKTVKKAEVKVLIRMLFSYYQHLRHYQNSLVTKFYGVHCVKPIGGQKVCFIVMGNLFCSDYYIHRIFDLKGSSHGRMTDKADVEIDEMTIFKDLDLYYVFRLHRS